MRSPKRGVNSPVWVYIHNVKEIGLKISMDIRKLVCSTVYTIRYTIVLFLLFSQVIAQTFEISGRVLNESGKKLGNARLTLYSMKHQLVATQTSKSNGKFKFKKIKSDKYTLNIYGEGGYTSTKEIDLRSAGV